MRGKKIRAPVSGIETLCQHMTSRRQGGMVLIMECQDCNVSNLNNMACYRGVIRSIQHEGAPTAIILRSHIERKYDSRSTRAMGQIAEMLNRVEELREQLAIDRQHNDKCSGCLRSLVSALENVKKDILSCKIHGAVTQTGIMNSYDFRNGSKCDECSGMTKIQLSSISKIASNLERDILAGAINIVGVE